MTATNVNDRWWRHQVRNLRHALLWGPDEPPPWLRPLARLSIVQVLAVIVVLVVLGAVLLGTMITQLHLMMGGLWWPIVMVLTLGLLMVMVRRPLLAWRIAWLALLYEVVALGVVGAGPRAVAAPSGDPSFGLYLVQPVHAFDWLPPLFVSPIQIAVFLTVLFVAAASQPRGVVFWVWLLTAGLVTVIPVTRRFDFVSMATDPWGTFGWLAYGGVGSVVSTLRPLLVGVAGMMLVTVVVLAGQLVRHQSRTRQQLAEVQERGLLLDERARIARELHDVVAHHVSMIAVRSETAPYRLGELPEQVRAEFAEISQASRESLSEMRRLLGVLRSDAPAPTAPQPGLADLAELVEWTRGAGTPVTLEMRGSMSGLPAAVDVSAYRILQEALTNAARHATGAPVHLRLERTDTHLSLSVRNGPRETAAGGDHGAPPAAGEGGHGVRGMRERIAMLGGQLQVGPTDDGGFEVTATLPLSGDAQ